MILQKLKFYKSDITQPNSYEIINSNKFKVHNSFILTCIEISKYNIIQCFYVNVSGYYTIGLYKEDSIDFINSTIIDEIPVNVTKDENIIQYHQCIHLRDEISILGYMINSENPNYIYIQIKKLVYNNKYSKHELENYLLRYNKFIVFQNNNIILDCSFYLTHLIKITDNKFSLISSSKDRFELYVTIFDIYNFRDTNLSIKYYKVFLKNYNFSLFQVQTSITFNGFLGVIYTTNILNGSEIINQYFSLLSYVNSTDSELIYIEKGSILKLSDYINNELIENNIFGVNLYGIKILKLPNSSEIGVYFISKTKNNVIYENDILSLEDEINFIYDYNDLKIDNSIYTIEFAGIVKEPVYSDIPQYAIGIEFYGNSSPESSYIPRVLHGRTSFYNFTINNTINGNTDNSCQQNCKICYNNICLRCINNYILFEDSNTCQINIPKDGYYYDKNSNIYKKCDKACKTCISGPIYYSDILEIEDTNCIECIDNYYKLIDTNNCVNKNNPPLAYYLDINKGLFLNCYETCKTCNQYKKNSTYLNCLSCDENNILYQKSTNCLDCSFRNMYVNYYQYKCIDFIPEGYYLYNNETKEIDSCYISCKHCEMKGNLNNHKCIECSEAYPYNYKNGTKCLDDCSKENLLTDFETNICYDDCSNNNNEKKCNYKNKCISCNSLPKNYILDDKNNFISICNPQTEYEFNNDCYNSCPDETKLDESITSKKLCICKNLYYLDKEDQICINSNVCPPEYPYIKLNSLICHNCPVTYKSKCLLSCPENTCISQNNENFIVCVDKLDETKIFGGICFDDFIRILDNIEKTDANSIIAINNYPGITISVYLNGINIDEVIKKYPNLTFINLEECGKELIKYYKLNINEELYIISIDIYNKISNRVSNEFHFEIYLKNGTQLEDLSVCKNLSISISAAITKLDLIHYDEAKIFKDQGYNIYNTSSEFYTDECTAAYINENDIIIDDRIEDIYPHNISLCSKGCKLKVVDIESKRVNCSCFISLLDNNMDLDNDENFENKFNIQTKDNFFSYLLDKINYKIFKCHKIVRYLNIKDLLKNIGFILGNSFIMFNLICIFVFYCSFLSRIRIKIFKLIPKNKKVENTIKNNENKNNSTNNIFNRKQNNKKLSMKMSLNKKRKSKNINKINLPNKKEQKFKYELKKIKRNSILSPFRKILGTNIKKDENDKSIKNLFISIYNDNNNYNNNDKEIEEEDYNSLPFTQALRLDKRNIFSIFMSILKMKINIISILVYPEEFTHKSLTLSMYFLEFLFNYFMNALLYTDDIVSQKYHNNGKLDMFTSLLLSLTSNIITSIIFYNLKTLASYNEYFNLMIKDIKNETLFLLVFKKLYKLLKIKICIYYIINLIISIGITYYLSVFCEIYKKIQISLLINYILGLLQSLIISLFNCLLISILRFVGLKYQVVNLYRTSVFLNDKL